MRTKILNLNLTQIEQFLVLVLTHKKYLDCKSIISLYDSIGDKRLLATCKHNKIDSIAADALITCYKHKELPDHWIKARNKTNQRIASYMQELDKSARLLADNGIKLVALKNSGITRGLYAHYGSCPMDDIDVLVCKYDFRRAHEILLNNDFQMKFRSPLEEENIESAEQGGGAEYAVKLSNGDSLWFELQWRPVAGRWIRPDQEPSADELMDRSVGIKGSSVRLLAPEDNLLQVCLHTAKHTYVRAPGFRLHTDVDRIVRECDIDWSLFVNLVNNLQVRTAVFFSLALARDLLNTPIPDHVLSKLSPSKWKVDLMSKWLQSVGLFDPDGEKWSKFGYILFVCLLYDSILGLVKGVIPSVKWMKQRYDINNPLLLPFYYIYRIIDLAYKRTLNKG